MLRELEEEDSLWYKNASDPKSAQQAKPEKPQHPADTPKDPVIPAETNVDEKTAKKSGATKKLNFY